MNKPAGYLIQTELGVKLNKSRKRFTSSVSVKQPGHVENLLINFGLISGMTKPLKRRAAHEGLLGA